MNNTSGFYNEKNNVKVFETLDENINMPICFVKDKDKRTQKLLVDAIPDELYYNPSSKTLFVDNIETKIANLQEGEAIQIDNSVNNKTTVNVNFSKNTDVITTLADSDTILISNTSNQLKTIRGDKIKENFKIIGGTNLSFGTGVNSNTLNLDSTIENVALDSGCSWNGNLILAPKISNGAVSDSEFQKLNGLTSAILQTSDKDQNNGVCGLDGNGFVPTSNLPASIDDIRNFADVAAFPEIGENPPPEAGIIYVALDTKKSYRWNGLASGANSVVYTEITNGLVIGTGASNAFAGNLGTANTAAIANKQNTLTASSTSGIVIDGSSNIDIDMTKSNVETEFDDNELMLIQKTNGNICRLTKQQLKSSINTNTEYDFATPNLVTAANGTDISLNTTLGGMVKISVGSSHAGATAGLETFGKIIASRIDSNSVKDVLYLNNAGSGSNAKVGVIYRVGTNNFVTRFDGTNYLLGSSNAILDGVLTEYLRVGSSETKISGDCNLTDSHTYKINDASIDGTNLNFANNKLNLDATLTGLTSVSVRNDSSECLMLKTQNSSFLEECCITMTKNNGTSETNFGIRFDGINLKFGSSNAVVNGTLTEYMRISSQELKVSGNCNLTSGHNYKINGTIIGHSYTGSTNISIDSSKNINLDTTITGLSSVTSTNFVGELNGNAATVTNGVYTTGTQNIGGLKTFTSKLRNNAGCEIEVMDGADTNTTNAIYMWTRQDTNWGIYMARSGSNRSMSNGTACTGRSISGGGIFPHSFTQYAIRFRVQNASGGGFIFENSSENLLMSLNGNNANLTVKGGIETGGLLRIGFDNLSNFVTTGLNPGNDPTPHIWVGNNGSSNVNGDNFTNGFGFVYDTSGNYQLIRKSGSVTPVKVFTVGRADGHIEFKADISSSNLNGNVGNRLRYDLSAGTLLLQYQYPGSGTHRMVDLQIATTNVSGPVSRGRIEWNGNTMLYGNFSDRRLKTDIVEIKTHFDILDKLNPVNYKMIDAPYRKYGFIADELLDVFPQSVSGEPDKIDIDGNPDYMMVDETNLISILTKCLKDNTQEIKELKKENDELKKKNKDIVDKMYELELKLNIIYEKLNISYI